MHTRELMCTGVTLHVYVTWQTKLILNLILRREAECYVTMQLSLICLLL